MHICIYRSKFYVYICVYVYIYIYSFIPAVFCDLPVLAGHVPESFTL